MSMTPEQHQRVKTLFMSACEMSPAERRALLDRECADDPLVRAEVEGLLGHDSDPHDGLKTPALGIAMTTMLGKALKPTVPTELPERVGPYRVTRVLGVGGMGIVYLAEQDRPRRTVALKVMQAGPGAASLLRRFEHEADLLGRLRHPGIAQIYESGMAGEGPLGKPYIAMEYVDGKPLNEAAVKRSLSIRQRVELMVKVCDAVQHAHQRGVIHRDLKPGNILVDDSGQPKVLDFGVARATDADLQLTSMNTGVGQMVGTLPYMSPEQVMGDPREIDTRSDVYALGVILYQVLTNRLPHEPGKKSLPELARIIRDEAPARLSSIDRTLRGDLDTIVGKAMEKEKPRRYQSAAALGDDLRRFTTGEPISAKADSALYVIGKQLRRHKAPVAAAVLALVGLVVFAVYAVVQGEENKRLARQARVAEAQATARADEAELASDRERAARAEAQRAEARAAAELESANIQRGRAAVQAGSSPGAEELLWPAFLRDPGSDAARWALWEYCCQFGSRGIVQAHVGAIRTCHVSLDGKRVYTAGYDGDVRAWDVQSMELLAEDLADATGMFGLVVSPDGTRVVATGGGPGVRVLDARTLERVAVLDMTGNLGRTVAFSADGARLMIGHVTGRISMWDTATWTKVDDRVIHPGQVAQIEVAPGGWPIATSDTRGNISIWEAGNWETPVRTWKGHLDEIPSLQFVDGGKLLVSGGNDERARVWEVATATQIAELEAPNGSVRDIDLAPDGRTLVSSGWWGVNTWDIATWTRARSLSMPATVFDISLTPDGKIGFAVLENGTLRSWWVEHGPEVATLPGHSGRTVGMLSADGLQAVTGDSAGMLRVWDARTGAMRAEVRSHADRIRTVLLHPTRPLVATCNAGELVVRDLATLEVVWGPIPVFALSHRAFDFSPDGATLAVFRRDAREARLLVFDAASGEERASYLLSRSEQVSVRYTPDGSRMVVVQRGPSVQVLDAASGTPVKSLDLNGRLAWSIDFAADGSLMAMGDWDREVTIWQTSDWTMRRKLTGHAGLVYDVGFSPAGNGLVASAGAEGTVRLWDALEGRALLTLNRFGGWTAHSVSFAPSGTRLLSCNAHNGEVVIWDLTRYDRDIARQVEYEVTRRGEAMGATLRAEAAREWARGVMLREGGTGGDSVDVGNARALGRYTPP